MESRVVFAELDWVPGNVTQAEDRCDRIGQTNSVLCQHIVVDGSLDAVMAATIVKKQNVIDQAIDAGISDLTIEEVDDLVLEIYTPEKEGSGVSVSVEKKSAILDALRFLSARCDGAQSEDGIGFAGCDVHFGHSLAKRGELSGRMALAAEKMLQKYKNTQLGDLWTAIEECE